MPTACAPAAQTAQRLTIGRPEYEVHHLVEKRFYDVPGISVFKEKPDKAPSVILKKDVHKGYTGRARAEFKYGTIYSDLDHKEVLNFYKAEYGGNKDWLDLVYCCFE